MKIPTFIFFVKSTCLWIPITFNVLNKITGEPDEPSSVEILWSNSNSFIFIILPLRHDTSFSKGYPIQIASIPLYYEYPIS